ncbi:MAG: hypothetical protein KatS3mg105_1109 [Gemmatales bacterium]|nr:MAG: hypothetical protein KatS3mg105_1109 [Gemmatales bacterium]
MELAKNLMIDSVSRLPLGAPRYVAPHQSVAEAVALMRQERVGCLLVCQDEQVAGIFTERDLLRRVMAKGQPLTINVSECMTPSPVVVHPKESVASAIRKMSEGGYRHLPVVDEAGKAIGILSARRIMHYLVEHFPATVYNLPPDPKVVPQSPEGA